MAYTVVGLFQNREKAAAVSTGLEFEGFKDSDYIIYKTNNPAEHKPTLWERIFGSAEIDFVSTEADKVITSVEIHNKEEMNAVKKVFEDNEVVHTYEFQDMTIEEAKDLNYIKKIIEIRAKSQIFTIPESRKFGTTEGMNSEVKV